ncbi:hypothetical protein BDN70DRAFT_918779 [Pholiota conissans]|uniref:C2H2-type domain-containing protein n=1 Tax=Pholiota conissans TaxID=109636 RepID=A0A9P5Z8M5_9AGAR|nr:hypothetical protein BDN70DRAFT_918779 [Pholiota conissans]
MQTQMGSWKNNKLVEGPSSILLQNRSTSHIKESDENNIISCPPYKSFQAVALDTPQPSSSGEPTGSVNEGVCKRPLQPYNKIKASALRDLDVPTVLEPRLTTEMDYQVSRITPLSTSNSTLATVSVSVTLKPSNPPNVTTSPKPSRSINESVSDNVPPHLLDPSCLVDIPCVYDACDGTSVFRGRKAWRLHLREYHGVPGGASARGVCLYPGCDQVRAKMKGGLLRHIIADHSQVGLQCRQCDRNPFTREDPLVRHYKWVHRDQYFEDRHDVVYSDEVEV